MPAEQAVCLLHQHRADPFPTGQQAVGHRFHDHLLPPFLLWQVFLEDVLWGYAYVEAADGKALTSTGQVKAGDVLTLQVFLEDVLYLSYFLLLLYFKIIARNHKLLLHCPAPASSYVKETGHAIEKEALDTIYELKTSALIEASMMIGAILGGASEEEVKIIEKIAKDVGIAFQDNLIFRKVERKVHGHRKLHYA